MKYIHATILFTTLLLAGCSVDTPLATTFVLPKGSEIAFQREISTAHSDKELLFELTDIPESKKDSDFSDYIDVTLTDTSGNSFKPEKILDINGFKRDIVAICRNIPKGKKITTIKIIALKDIKGTRFVGGQGKWSERLTKGFTGCRKHRVPGDPRNRWQVASLS